MQETKFFLDDIILTEVPNLYVQSNQGYGKLINLSTYYNYHIDPLYKSLFNGPNFPALQNQTYGQFIRKETPDGIPYIMSVQGAILIDIDNHDEVYWSKDKTEQYAEELHNSIIQSGKYTGYALTDISKSGTGIHQIWYFPLTEQDPDKRFIEYIVNTGLIYDKVVKFLSPIINYSVDDIFNNGIMDLHNMVPWQKFVFSNTKIWINERYKDDYDDFSSFIENAMTLGYPVFMQSHESYLDIIDEKGKSDSSPVSPLIKEAVYNIVGKEKKRPEGEYVFHTGELRIPTELDNPTDAVIKFDHNNRLKLVTTLMHFMDEDPAVKLAIDIYDQSHNYDSNRSKAISDIKRLASTFDSRIAPSYRIIDELRKYGIELIPDIPESSESSGSLKTHIPSFYVGLEGIGLNGSLPDEQILLGDGFISDYYNHIQEILSQHQNLYIKAGCGTGKSTFFRNLLEREKQVAIICHLNSIKDGVYGKRENKNSSGSNDIFNLSDDQFLTNFILDPKDITEIIFKNRPLPNKIVISWDGYQKLLENGYDQKLSFYIKCLDESHNLISSLNYRNGISKQKRQKEGVISCLTNTKYNFQHTILCSGTPLFEYELFNDMYKLEFLKEDKANYKFYYQQIINLDEGEANPVKIANDIYYWINDNIDLNSYDSVIVYSNAIHKHLYSMFTQGDFDVCNFCKDKKDSKDVKDILSNNTLNNKIMLTTVYGSQGIEIKNGKKKVACIFHVEGMSNVDIIQTIHRFRDVEHADCYLIKHDSLVHKNQNFQKQINALHTLISNPEKKQELLAWAEERKSEKEFDNIFIDSTMFIKANQIDHQKILLAELHAKYILSYTIGRTGNWFNIFKPEILKPYCNSVLDSLYTDHESISMRLLASKYYKDLIDWELPLEPKLFFKANKIDISAEFGIKKGKLTDRQSVLFKRHMRLIRRIKYLVLDDEPGNKLAKDALYQICDIFNYKSRSGVRGDAILTEKGFEQGDIIPESKLPYIHFSQCYKILSCRYKIFKQLISKGTYFKNVLDISDNDYNYIVSNLIQDYMDSTERLALGDIKVEKRNGVDYYIPDENMFMLKNWQLIQQKLMDFELDEYGRNRKGKALKLKYKLISDPENKFHNKKECFEYLQKENQYNKSWKYFDKIDWKNFFEKA